MKKLFFFFFLLPLFSNAQECSLKKSVDAFTHEPKLSTGFISFNKGSLKLSISVDATPAIIDFFLWVTNDGKCFDDASTAELVFEGEKIKMKFKNTGSMNCDGAFHFSFKNTQVTTAQLNKIATKKINTIKLVGNNKTETMIILTDEQKTQLMTMAACVAAEGKSLIKN